MKTSTIIAIVLPTVAVGGLGAYFILRRKPGDPGQVYLPPLPAPPMAPGRIVAAQAAAVAGPAVAAKGGVGWKSLTSGIIGGVAGQASGLANKIVPGSGTIIAPVANFAGKLATAAVQTTLGTVGSTAKKALSKLKFW